MDCMACSVQRLGYGLDDPVVENRQEQEIFLFPNRSDRLWSPRFLFSGYQGCFLGLKRPGGDVDQSSPSCTKIRNEWSYISTPV